MTKDADPAFAHRTRTNLRSPSFYTQNDGDSAVASWPDTNLKPHLDVFNAQVAALAAVHDTETDAEPQDAP